MDHSKGSRVPEVVITCKQKQLMSADNRQAQTIVQQWQNIKKLNNQNRKQLLIYLFYVYTNHRFLEPVLDISPIAISTPG